MCSNTVMMLNNICWLWKAKAEQHGWGDRSAQLVWEMQQNRQAQMVSGQILLFGIILPFYKRKERAVSHKCLLLCLSNCTAPLCLLLFGYSWELCHLHQREEICVEYNCGEKTWFWPRGFINFVFPSWKSLVDLCLHPFILS